MAIDHQSLEVNGVRHKELPSIERIMGNRYVTEEKQSNPLTAVPREELDLIYEKDFLRTNSQSTMNPASSQPPSYTKRKYTVNSELQ